MTLAVLALIVAIVANLINIAVAWKLWRER